MYSPHGQRGEKTKPFPVEWLLEEWENLAQRESLLQFYCSGVKMKLYVQGTHAAVLFSTLTSDKEEALLAVQLKGDILSRESDYILTAFVGQSCQDMFKTLYLD